MIDLYSWGTPNGWKASIALEELQLPYRLVPVDLRAGEQNQPSFLRLNPNGRIPVIVDRDNDDFVVFESGAILIYLAELAGQLLPAEQKGRSEVLQWLMFQMSGIGPMMGQAGIFKHLFHEHVPSVISRFENESRRLLAVVDARLGERDYLCGEFSIADIAVWPWARTHHHLGIELDAMPALAKWLETMAARPACRKGLETPPFRPPPKRDDDEAPSLVMR